MCMYVCMYRSEPKSDTVLRAKEQRRSSSPEPGAKKRVSMDERMKKKER